MRVDCGRMVKIRIWAHDVPGSTLQVASDIANDIFLTGVVWSMKQADYNYQNHSII